MFRGICCLKLPGRSSRNNHPHLAQFFGYQENDETLYEHRKGNSAKLLLLKSLLSQSVPALVIASAMDDVLQNKKNGKWVFWTSNKDMKG